jgi:DNA-binding transcriptional regulator YiaG
MCSGSAVTLLGSDLLLDILLQEGPMKPIHPDYPSLIKEVRRRLAISQEDLARELGVSYATVNR